MLGYIRGAELITMYPPHLAYLSEKGTTWFNPCNGLTVFWDEFRKLQKKLNKPFEYVWNHRELKRAKEIYATSIIAAMFAQQDGTTWWVHKPKNDPPDGVIGTMVQEDGVVKMRGREIEVVEHLNGEIIDTIKNKLTKKFYEPNTVLVCYLSKGGTFNPEKIAEELSKGSTNLNNIFLVFPGVKLSDIPSDAEGDDFIRAIFKISLVQVKPVFAYVSIDPIEFCKNWREGKEKNFFILEGRGKGGSKEIHMENPPKLF